MNKKRLKNKGTRTSYYIENNHLDIISKEMYNKVQEEMSKRTHKVVRLWKLKINEVDA